MDSATVHLATSLSILFVSAIAGGLLAKQFRQPTILGYITAGIVMGNLFSPYLDRQMTEMIAQSGVTLLLFTLGVEFSFRRLRRVMHTVAWAASVQILVSTILFLTVFLLLNMAFLPALFIAVAASLSSTAIVVKILAERGELDSVPGEVATGWLVVQDMAVIPIMMVLPAISVAYMAGTTSPVATLGIIGINLAKAAGAIFAIVILGKYAIPKLLSWVVAVGSREILLVTTVGIVLASGMAAYAAGLSAALGAFIAGLVIAETSQNHAIFSEIRPLRDLFAIVFFVSLGMSIPVSFILPSIPELVGISLIVLLGKALVVYIISRFLGYHRKTAFLLAVLIAEMSEFAFIIANVGFSLGVLGEAQYSYMVTLAFLTIVIGAPLMSRGNTLYYGVRKALGKRWPKLFTDRLSEDPDRELPFSDHVVICGYGRVGRYVGRALEMAEIPFIVVDYDHHAVSECRKRGIPAVYGDPADIDVLDYAQVDKARIMIIAIPDRHTQELVISNAQTLNKHIRIYCRTHHEDEQRRLKSLGVTAVIQPEFEAALSIVGKLYDSFGVEDKTSGTVSRLKIEHGLG